LDGWWFRSAAISCAFASCTLVAGPGFVGIAPAHAGLFGIDFFDDDDKSDMHHPRPGSEISAQSTRSAAEAPTAKIGSAPESDAVPESTAMHSIVGAQQSVAIAQTVGGGGSGVPRANTAGRAPNLRRVSSAPITRSVVIRRPPQATTAVPAYVPPAPQSPAVMPLAAPPPQAGEPHARPQPAGPLAPSPTAPKTSDPLAPGGSGAARVPDSFRVGYAEYLRSADIGDLFVAALPGVVGITGFTLVGAYAGYRQAKALQRALLAPAPTRILL
jgi:hypothetical protein